VDVAFVSNPQKDIYLPSLYSGEKRRVNWTDETGAWVYAKMKPSDNTSLDVYYIFKNEENPPLYTGNELDLHTFGARGVIGLGSGIGLRGEFAYQTGEYDNIDVDREAFGGYVFVSKGYKEAKWSPKLDLGVVFLSGDDPSTTDKDEGWNPLFAGWPKWSELFIFTQAPERTIAYWTNLAMARATVKLKFSDKAGGMFGYNYLRADEADVPSPAPFYSRDSKDRGHLFQAKASYKFTKKIDAYVLVEYLSSGNFYTGTDDAFFTRWQLQFKL